MGIGEDEKEEEESQKNPDIIPFLGKQNLSQHKQFIILLLTEIIKKTYKAVVDEYNKIFIENRYLPTKKAKQASIPFFCSVKIEVKSYIECLYT